MANILYGICGEGFGHAARSKEVVDYLVSAGHKVVLISYDRGFKYLSEFYEVEEISGLNITYKDNEVKYLPTVFNNFLKSHEAVRSLEKVSKIVADHQINLVISDFEPIASTIAKLKKLPLISIDNQHILTDAKVDYFKNYHSAYLVDKMVSKLMVFGAKAYLVLSFFPCQAKNKRTFIFPPIIKSEILSAPGTVGDKILVYLTSGDEGAISALKNQPAEFIIYGLNKNDYQGNLTFKLADRQTFLDDLLACRAIIANAGFSLISEALYLTKPYLAVPAKQQYEQTLNAHYLSVLGYGEYHENLTPAVVSGFLSKLDDYRQTLNGAVKSGNQAVFSKLAELIKVYTK